MVLGGKEVHCRGEEEDTFLIGDLRPSQTDSFTDILRVKYLYLGNLVFSLFVFCTSFNVNLIFISSWHLVKLLNNNRLPCSALQNGFLSKLSLMF